MQKITYMSRHQLAPEALMALEERFGKVEVTQKDILFPASAPEAWEVLKQDEAQVIVFVAPAQLTAEVIRRPKEMQKTGVFVVSVPALAPDGTSRMFRFDHLEIFDM